MKAMILSAGLGTRLKPFTNNHPKALALVNKKSLLQRNVEYLQRFGIRELIINVHHFSEQIVEAVNANNGWGSSITISDETDAVLETGGGLQKARWYFEGEQNFVLMNVDILTNLDLQQMISQHTEQTSLATLATTNRQTSRYFLFDEQNTLCGWRNKQTGDEKISKPAKTFYERAFSGIHIINAQLLLLLKQEGKFSMVDVYLQLAKEHQIQSFDHSGSTFIDVGKPESISKAETLFV